MTFYKGRVTVDLSSFGSASKAPLLWKQACFLYEAGLRLHSASKAPLLWKQACFLYEAGLRLHTLPDKVYFIDIKAYMVHIHYD